MTELYPQSVSRQNSYPPTESFLEFLRLIKKSCRGAVNRSFRVNGSKIVVLVNRNNPECIYTVQASVDEVRTMNRTNILAILKPLAVGIALFVFVTNGGVSKAGGRSTGGSTSSTSSSTPTTTSTLSDTQPKSGEYGKTVGDFPVRDTSKGGTVAATAPTRKGKSLLIQNLNRSGNTIANEAGREAKDIIGGAEHVAGDISAEAGRAVKNVTNAATVAPQNIADFLTGKAIGQQFQRSGQDIANEAGRAAKNVGAVVGGAANQVSAEAQRAPQNVADFLTGKNDSDKQLINNIQGGINQLGQNIQAGGDAFQRIECGPGCYNILPTSRDIGNELLRAGKNTKAEINRDINKIGTGKDLGRDISRTADKAGDDISRAATTAAKQAGDAASHAANQVSNAANQAGQAAGSAENSACSAVGLGC